MARPPDYQLIGKYFLVRDVPKRKRLPRRGRGLPCFSFKQIQKRHHVAWGQEDDL